MYKIKCGQSGIEGSVISLGCMRLPELSIKEAEKLIETALDKGIDFFDHADIYGSGQSEEIFAQAVKQLGIKREQMILQTKCGIRPGFFDFSKEHIIHSVEESLKRLQTDYVDILLLHRPDTLMEPEEVAEAFRVLKESGKVKAFGVSNQNPMQMALLNKYLDEKLIINQLQLSIAHTPMFDSGFNVNMNNPSAIERSLGVVEYCRLEDITIQAWSPFQFGFFEGVFIDHPKFKALNEVLDTLSKDYGVTKEAIAIAWILRHPAKIQPIVGTTNAQRLTNIAEASKITLSREEWYKLYCSTGNVLP